LIFNYLGQLDPSFGAGSPFVPARWSAGEHYGPDNARFSQLYVLGLVLGDRLDISFRYSANQFRRETIQRLGDTYLAVLRELVGGLG
jgi:non-ribosomal peptide synthase protein (TIGR01720 family)